MKTKYICLKYRVKITFTINNMYIFPNSRGFFYILIVVSYVYNLTGTSEENCSRAKRTGRKCFFCSTVYNYLLFYFRLKILTSVPMVSSEITVMVITSKCTPFFLLNQQLCRSCCITMIWKQVIHLDREQQNIKLAYNYIMHTK